MLAVEHLRLAMSMPVRPRKLLLVFWCEEKFDNYKMVSAERLFSHWLLMVVSTF